MKNPWFKFYRTNWLADEGIRSCSLAARGMWIDTLCLMDAATPRGFLLVGKSPPSRAQLAKIFGVDVKTCNRLLAELADAGVSSEENGILFSRKMVRDEEKLQRDRENGKAGGNPNIRRGLSEGLTDPPKQEARGQMLDTREEKKEKRKEEVALRASTPKKGTRIPDDWKPDSAYAESKGLRQMEIQRESEKFKNYWTSRAGAGAIKVDWAATWRTWVLSCAEKLGRSPTPSATPAASGAPAQKDWPRIMKLFEMTSNWKQENGPPPGYDGCMVPVELLPDTYTGR